MQSHPTTKDRSHSLVFTLQREGEQGTETTDSIRRGFSKLSTTYEYDSVAPKVRVVARTADVGQYA